MRICVIKCKVDHIRANSRSHLRPCWSFQANYSADINITGCKSKCQQQEALVGVKRLFPWFLSTITRVANNPCRSSSYRKYSKLLEMETLITVSKPYECRGLITAFFSGDESQLDAEVHVITTTVWSAGPERRPQSQTHFQYFQDYHNLAIIPRAFPSVPPPATSFSPPPALNRHLSQSTGAWQLYFWWRLLFCPRDRTLPGDTCTTW